MNDLVINYNGTLATTQDKVSVLTDNNEQSVQRLIRTYEADLKEFGELNFQNELICNSKNKINYRKVYYLNEQQATLLLTYMKNTPKVREAKKILVKAFYDMRQELQALKFRYYVDEISNLRAVRISQGRHNQNVINGYKSQLSQRNALIVDREKQITKLKNKLAFFDAPEFKPFSSSHPSYLELFKLYIEALGKCNALNIRIDGLIMENEKLKRFDKGERIAVALAKIQKEVERVYSGIGAVMAYASDGDRYFLEHNEITKG